MTSRSLQLQNKSTLPIKFSMRLDSLSSTKRDHQQLPQFLVSRDQRAEVVGELAGGWGLGEGGAGGEVW